MAVSANEDFGTALAGVVEIIFSPLFPVILITLCGLSWLLGLTFHLPQFELFAVLSIWAVEYARTNIWAALALGAFVIAALPLARVGLREHDTKTSRVIGYWVAAGLYAAFMLWLASAWTFDRSGFQQLVFGLLLFGFWAHVCETALGTVKLISLARPQPGPEVVEAQKAHGHAQLAGEAEAISLLRVKK